MEATTGWLSDVLPRYRWRPGVSRCYEIWYGKLNYEHAGAACAFWFRYELLTHPFGEPARADLWGIHYNASDAAENFHLHETFAIGEVRVSSDAFAVEFDRDAHLSYDAGSGTVRAVGGEAAAIARLRWDLSFHTREPGFQYVSPSFLAGLLASSNACTPFEDVRYDGVLLLDAVAPGESPDRRDISGAPGMLGHLWGQKHADGWCWLHANQFKDESGEPVDAAIEALTLWRGADRRTVTTVCFKIGDSVFRSNGPLQLARYNRGESTRGGYRLESECGDLKLEAFASVEPSRTQTFELIDTDGSRLSNTSSLVADLEVIARVGKDASPRRLLCRSAAALEKVDRA